MSNLSSNKPKPLHLCSGIKVVRSSNISSSTTNGSPTIAPWIDKNGVRSVHLYFSGNYSTQLQYQIPN